MLVSRPSSVPAPLLLIVIVWGAGAGLPAATLKVAVLLDSAIVGSVGGVTPPPPSPPPHCSVNAAHAAMSRGEKTFPKVGLELIMVVAPSTLSGELHAGGVLTQLRGVNC